MQHTFTKHKYVERNRFKVGNDGDNLYKTYCLSLLFSLKILSLVIDHVIIN